MNDDQLYMEMSQEEYDSLDTEEIEMIMEFISEHEIVLRVKK